MSDAGGQQVLHVFSTFSVGGPQVRTAALINRFGGRFSHQIVAMDGNYACRERIDAGIDVRYPGLDFHKGATWENVRQFRRFLRESRPNVLVTSNWGTIEWAMANLPRLVRHVHMEDGFGPEERSTQIPRRVWTRRLVLRGSCVVVPSRVLQRIATERWRLPKKAIRYVPNGVDLHRFAAPEVAGGDAGWPGEGPVIGTVAALRAEKNLARLIKAFRLVVRTMPARLVIIGDGPERAELEGLAQQLGISEHVHFAGHMADPQLAYRGFDLFAISSDTEQMPLSVLEAMAAGLAVAGTDVGDIACMVASENAPFIVSKDDVALGGAMLKLAGDPGLRTGAGAANRAKAVREFDQEAMFAAYFSLFGGLPPSSEVSSRAGGN
jgi:glycosyltransferase involved in cell wall biosynthesis